VRLNYINSTNILIINQTLFTYWIHKKSYPFMYSIDLDFFKLFIFLCNVYKISQKLAQRISLIYYNDLIVSFYIIIMLEKLKIFEIFRILNYVG